LNLQPFP